MSEPTSAIIWDEVINAQEFINTKRVSMAKRPGVYGIRYKGEWQYVGRSINNAHNRVFDHISAMELFETADLNEMTFYFHFCEFPILEELKYIYFLRPVLNNEVRLSFGYEKSARRKPEYIPGNAEAKRRLVKLL